LSDFLNQRADEHALTNLSRILRNLGFLTVGKLLGDLFTFLFFVALSRYFGDDGIGQYSFAIAFTGFFEVLANFGLYNLSVKEISRRPTDLDRYCSHVFIVRIILSVIALFLLLFVLRWLPFTGDTKWIILLVGIFQISHTILDGAAAVFVALERMHVAAALELSLRVFIAFAGITVMWEGGGLATAISTMPLVCLVHTGVGCALLVRHYGSPRWAISVSSLKTTLQTATPYAMTALVRQVSTRTDVVLLGFMLGASVAGVYNVAYRIVSLVQFLPYFTGLALFPTSSKLYGCDLPKLVEVYRHSLNTLVLAALPAAAGLWLIAPQLVISVFGEDFSESVGVLRILAAVLFFTSFKMILAMLLTSCDRQKLRMRSEWIAATANIGANLALIPLLGARGPAVAALLSESLAVLLFTVHLRPVLGWPNCLKRATIAAAATSCFVLPGIFVPVQPWALLVPAAALIYLAVILMFKDVREHELRPFIALLRARREGT
jgi:O-antigen/teichoic acid export membrane protein